MSTRLDDAGFAALVARLLDEAGVGPELPGLPEASRPSPAHVTDGRGWQILLNHRAEAVRLPEPAHDLLTGARCTSCRPAAARCCERTE